MLIDQFLTNSFIRDIKDNPLWTITDIRDKKPLDARLLLDQRITIGASFERDHSPLVKLNDIILWLAASHLSTPNFAYYLNAQRDDHVILDIEPKCPPKVKQHLIHGYKWDYGEYSLSGNGVHLGFLLPKDHALSFERLSVLKHPQGYYEFLINQKYCTFTMRQFSPFPSHNKKSLYDLLLPLYTVWKAKQATTISIDVSSQRPNISEETSIKYALHHSPPLKKTIVDYAGDSSRYEFAYACLLTHQLRKIIANMKDTSHNYLPDHFAWLIYEELIKRLDPRDKHREQREHLPWLLYLAKTAVSQIGI